jgi:hypothetical protein
MVVEPRPSEAAAVATDQVRRHATLIQKEIASRLAEREEVAPPAAGVDDIRASLLVGVDRFF